MLLVLNGLLDLGCVDGAVLLLFDLVDFTEGAVAQALNYFETTLEDLHVFVEHKIVHCRRLLKKG